MAHIGFDSQIRLEVNKLNLFQEGNLNITVLFGCIKTKIQIKSTIEKFLLNGMLRSWSIFVNLKICSTDVAEA